MKKIVTKEELINHLTRICSPYRKSYKLYGNSNRVMQIFGGLVRFAAVAVVPAISVFIAALSVASVIIGVMTYVTIMGDIKQY